MRKKCILPGLAAAFSAARRVRRCLREAAWPHRGPLTRLVSWACVMAVLRGQVDVGDIRADAARFDVWNADSGSVAESHVFAFYRGTPVLWHSMKRRSSFAVDGVIFLDRRLRQIRSDTVIEQTLRHEWGHTVQERMLGHGRWLRAVAVPSVRGFRQELPTAVYYRQPWERSADFYGTVQRGNTGEAAPSLQYLDGWLNRQTPFLRGTRKNRHVK